MMKKLVYVGMCLLALLATTSCNKKGQTKAEESQEFRNSLTNTDTLSMLNICDSCMMLLQDKNLEGALAMLYEYDDSTGQVSSLSDETRQRYERLFNMFPVLSFQRVKYTFMLEGLNDVKYDVVFAEEEHPEVNGVPKTSFMFNPVRVDGTWYLTVKRGDQDIAR